jgi:hypothetical protein
MRLNDLLQYFNYNYKSNKKDLLETIGFIKISYLKCVTKLSFMQSSEKLLLNSSHEK